MYDATLPGVGALYDATLPGVGALYDATLPGVAALYDAAVPGVGELYDATLLGTAAVPVPPLPSTVISCFPNGTSKLPEEVTVVVPVPLVLQVFSRPNLPIGIS